MKLKKLFKNIPVKAIKGSRDVEITGVCANSRLVSPGNLFIARKGKSCDGQKYIPEAMAAGCVAVLTDIFDPTLPIVQVICEDVAALEAEVAATYYQSPSDELFMVGITGTNGKTTTSFLIKHLLDQFLGPSGLLGTIEYIIGRHRYQATRTTPDVSSNHKLLKEMVLQGCRSSVMEVTSHALAQGRVDKINFDVALFTNLTQDHLDYHGTMEAYAKAKNKLFRTMENKKKKNFQKCAIVNGESEYLPKIIEGCQVPILTYGIEGPFDLIAKNIKISPKGTTFILENNGKETECFTPLVGRFNISNTLAAMGVALSQKIPLNDVVKRIATFNAVPGRLEPVPNDLGIEIYVDFAHSEDALVNVLSTLKEMKKGKIITVFGCGGDRDPLKRPKMGRAVEAHSDFAVVTTDNSRSENPEEIVKAILEGFETKNNYLVELDRLKAIEKAIEMADQSDIVLIAGKGHETQQIFAHGIIDFDDRQVAKQVCDNLHDKRVLLS